MTVNAADLKQAIATLSDLIAFDTTPSQPTAPLLDYVEGIFQQHGLSFQRVDTQPGRHGVLLARIGPQVAGGCLLSGHIDVVPVEGQSWQSDPFTLRNDGERLYGRGTCDMKGFAGCVLSMLPYWQQATLTKPIYIAFTCDEETAMDSIGDVLRLIDPSMKPTVAILGEPTGMDIVGTHKGAQEFVVNFKGVPAHASRIDLGVNAINAAARLINMTDELQEQLKVDVQNDTLFPPYATVCVGMIKGGNAVNTVAEHCCVHWNVRQVANTQTELVLRALDDFMATEATAVNYERNAIPALELRCDNPAIRLGKTLLQTDEVKTAAFATEGGHYQIAGIDCIVCGPGHIEQAHRPDEYVDIAQLEKCLAFLARLSDPDIQAML